MKKFAFSLIIGLIFLAFLYINQHPMLEIPEFLSIFGSKCWDIWAGTYQFLGKIGHDHGLHLGLKGELQPYLGAMVLGCVLWLFLSIVFGIKGFLRDLGLFFPLST